MLRAKIHSDTNLKTLKLHKVRTYIDTVLSAEVVDVPCEIQSILHAVSLKESLQDRVGLYKSLRLQVSQVFWVGAQETDQEINNLQEEMHLTKLESMLVVTMSVFSKSLKQIG